MLILISLIVFFRCSYLLLKDCYEFEENNQATEVLIEENIVIDNDTNEVSIDWKNLKAINPDIIGWIEIENTNINYPILKDDDSLFYLKHTFDRTYNSNGSIFTTDSSPFESEETTIYGHNMKNGSMFSDLEKYLNKEFLNSHLSIRIYTPNCNYEGEIFSVYSIGIETENDNIKNLDFNERINYYKNASKYSIENNVECCRILKLSTCSYINATTRPTNQRYYIIANLIPIK